MRARGFSLVELLVALAVSALVVLAGVSLLVGTHRSFQGGVNERAMQEAGRIALDEITRNLRMAGYGLEPSFVLDFGQATAPMDRLPTGATARFGGYQCPPGSEVTCRDRANGPDELVFYSRDPAFSRDLAGPVGANSITLTASALQQTALNPGQILQLMCYGTAGQWLWAYVTVQSVDATNPAAVQVTLAPGAGNDFPRQNALLLQPCFAAGTRRAFKIDRYRYYVAAVDPAGNVRPWGTALTRPYLMLDQGFSDANGPIVSPVAPDVEDLQVAYVFPFAPAGAQVVGATPGAAVALGAAGIDLALASAPTVATPTLDPLRTTHHPSNVRAVRVALTVRTERLDPAIRDAVVPAALNRPAVAGEAGYRRIVFESSAYMNNLENRLPVFPMFDPTYTTASCAGTAGNCGGG